MQGAQINPKRYIDISNCFPFGIKNRQKKEDFSNMELIVTKK